jgi:hypothetical protein
MKSHLAVPHRRVLVVDADATSREVMADRLRAEGYEVLPIEDPARQPVAELSAEFAVLRDVAQEDGAGKDGKCARGSGSTLTIGWFRPPRTLTSADDHGDLDEVNEHVRRILSVLASAFLTLDGAAVQSLANGLRVLGSTIWHSSSTTALARDGDVADDAPI